MYYRLHALPTHHVTYLTSFKSRMASDSEENILMLFTRLCLKELGSSSPEVKVSEVYMRRRCRERWSMMGKDERAAIYRLAGVGPGDCVNVQQGDFNGNCGAAEVEEDHGDSDEWRPQQKKRKRGQTRRNSSAFNLFEREKKGQKMTNRYEHFVGESISNSCIFTLYCYTMDDRELSHLWSKLSPEEKEKYTPRD